MSKYSDYLKGLKQNSVSRFFGDVKYKSNKYFTFDRYKTDDEVVITTNNIKLIKGSPVLIVGSNKAVYLKDWQVCCVHDWYTTGQNYYAVKLNRNFFKIYTFKSDFEDFFMDKDYNFDDMVDIAKLQDEDSRYIAIGHMGA